ncbi:peroxisome biogenesis factor 1-like isoform X3 [Varroa destructor]|uniref:Peroxisomal ATPase PEX1 n=1 Tax=Varroa destructor TaxID=109461 RepID=A0A7M7KRL4_VARDE|nr:peroxisome biogenesis factor 1-like isoform X3 [Varroa destructor]
MRPTYVVTFSVTCLASGVKAFFSWNGDETDDDAILVNSHMASGLGFKEGDEVVVCREHGVGPCHQVTLKPVSKKDWQILELNIARVEHCLLDQIRILWTDLVFPIWVQPSVCAMVRVVATSLTTGPLELSRMTEVHVIPEIETPLTLPASASATTSSKSVIGSLMNIMKNVSGMGASEEEEIQEEAIVASDEFSDFFLNKISARFIGNAVKTPQTEVILISNKVKTPRFVAMVRRLLPPGDAEQKKNKGPDSNPIIDSEANGANLLQDSVLCSIRVRLNPLNSDDMALCPLSLRRRLGLEDCSRLLIEFQKEKLGQIKSFTLHPVINARNALVETSELQSLVKSTLGAGKTLLSNGSYLQLGDCGYIVAIEKPGWLKAESSSFVITRGETIAPNGANQLPVTKLVNIIMSGTGSALEEVGSCGSIVEDLTVYLQRCLGSRGVCNRPLLITGSRGVGKSYVTTSVVRNFCRREAVWTKTVSCGVLRGKRTETLEKDWSKLLAEASFRAPSVLIFDDLDALCGQAVGPEGDTSHDGIYFLKNSRLFRDLVHRARQMKISFIVTAISWNLLCGALTRTQGLHIFSDVLEMRSPSREERLDIFKVLCRQRGLTLGDLSGFTQRTEGFVARDLATLADRVMLSNACEVLRFSGGNEMVSMGTLEPVLARVTPVALRGLNVERGSALSSRGHGASEWDAVGAMDEQKELLNETFLWPTRYPDLLAQCPIRPVSGLLLYGMPGTGKTLLASCVAKEADINFISVKGPELLSKYIGASEEAVRDIFLRAKSAAPCVIFFDEFDSMAPRRGHDSTGVTDRCVNQLLTLLDGVETDASGVAVLAATSRPDMIDPALLRPGRIDRSVECPLPPDVPARLSILRVLSSRLSVLLLPEAEDALESIAQRTDGFTGADLQAVLFNAQLAALQRNTRFGSNPVNSITLEPDSNVDEECSATKVSDEASSNKPNAPSKERQDFKNIAYAPTLSKGFIELTPNVIDSLPEPDRKELLWHLSSQQYESGDSYKRSSRCSRLKTDTIRISPQDLEKALRDTRPSLSEFEVKKYRAMYVQLSATLVLCPVSWRETSRTTEAANYSGAQGNIGVTIIIIINPSARTLDPRGEICESSQLLKIFRML